MKRFLAALLLAALALAVARPAAADWGALTGIHSIDISASSQAVWLVGTDNTVYSMPSNPAGTGTFTPVTGGTPATRVGVGPDNTAYIVGTDQGVYRYTGVGWLRLGTQTAIDVCANTNGPWIIGTDNKIYQWTGDQWKKFSDTYKGTRIGVTNAGRVFIVGMDGSIFDSAGADWARLKGMNGQDIAMSTDTPWIIGADNGIYYWQGNWMRYNGGEGQAITVCGGLPYVVGRDNKPYVGQMGAR